MYPSWPWLLCFLISPSLSLSLYIYIYIYPSLPPSLSIYIYAVELRTGPRFGVLCVKNWSKSCVKNWSKFFSVFLILHTQIVSICAKIVFLQNCRDVKNEAFKNEFAIFVFVFMMWGTDKQKTKEKQNGRRPKKPIKIVFFKVVIHNEKWKKMIFSKNCLTQFVSGMENKNAHFRAHYLFWLKNVGTKHSKPGKL